MPKIEKKVKFFFRGRQGSGGGVKRLREFG
jgi:hypothetical protein